MMRIISLAALLAFGVGCGVEQSPTQSFSKFKIFGNDESFYTVRHQEQTVFQIEVQKWRDGRRGAVSLTYDVPWGVDPRFELATDAAIARGVRMDVEMVTSKYTHPKRFPLIARGIAELLPNGVHFFGHGHTHVRHDHLEFDDAYASFKTDFDLMAEWGLNPKAYAYPHSSGKRISTQLANKQAGFIAARGGTNDPAEYYICPGDVRAPDNWYFLPSVVMGTKDGADIGSHRQLRPILAEAERQDAWVIMMYHSIGTPEGWAYYPIAEFEQDLDYIAASNLWSGNLDAVSAYIQERNALDINIVGLFGSETPREFEMVLRDNLDNAVYDEPLTLDFSFNPDLAVERVYFDPPIAGESAFDVVDGQLRMHIVPDERRYTLILD